MKENRVKPIYFFWIVFGASVWAMIYLYNAFLLNMLVAFLLCVCTYFLKNFFDTYFKHNWLSSLLSVLVLLLLFVLPVYFVAIKSYGLLTSIDQANFIHFINSTKAQIFSWLKELEWLNDYPQVGDKIREFLNGFSGTSILNYVLSLSTKVTASIAKWGISTAINLGFIVIFMYFFFYYSKSFSDYILKLIPLKIEQTMSIYDEVSGVLSVVFFTSLFNILLQGFCFGIVGYFFGYDGLLLGVLYGIASLIPIVGGSLVWIPVAFYQLYRGDVYGAIFITIYGAIFIGIVIDNIVKPLLITLVNERILKTSIKIKEMVIFFAILAGLNIFGFSGIIIGPAITAFFIALLRIYDSNFKN